MIKFSSDPAEFFTVSRYSRCSAVSFVSSASSVMPMMAFIGVRISWLMFARNSLFERVASSAFFFAISSSFTSCASRRASASCALPRRFQIIGVQFQFHFPRGAAR